MENEISNFDDPSLQTEFFRVGELMELYKNKFENPELLGEVTLSALGVERPE